MLPDRLIEEFGRQVLQRERLPWQQETQAAVAREGRRTLQPKITNLFFFSAKTKVWWLVALCVCVTQCVCTQNHSGHKMTARGACQQPLSNLQLLAKSSWCFPKLVVKKRSLMYLHLRWDEGLPLTRLPYCIFQSLSQNNAALTEPNFWWLIASWARPFLVLVLCSVCLSSDTVLIFEELDLKSVGEHKWSA